MHGRYRDQTHVVGSQRHQGPSPTSLPAPWAALPGKAGLCHYRWLCLHPRGMHFPWCHPVSLPGAPPNVPCVLWRIGASWTSAACPGSGLVGNRGGGQEFVSWVVRGPAPRGPGSATALLLASPGLCQATVAQLSAAGVGHAGRQGGVQPYLKGGLVPTSIFANLSWRPPRPHSLSTGDHKHFDMQGHPSPPLLPCPPSLPVLRCSTRVSGEVAGGLYCPGGLRQSCGEHWGPELPAAPQPGPGGCWWLWQCEETHLSGTGTLSDLLLGSQAWEIGLQAPR